MKKLLFSITMVLATCLAVSSCSKEELIESTNTVWAEFTIHNNYWQIDGNEDLYCTFNWPVIDEGVLACGNIMVYYYDDNERQVPLPYVLRYEYVNPITGAVDQVPLNIRFDIEPGIITFVISDLSEYRINPVDLLTMQFRAVCTYPVVYSI